MIKDKEDITLDNETLDNLYQKLKPKFERFIDDVLPKVDPKLEGALWLFIASSLSNFRDMIENPEEKEVSWENPGVEGILTCDIDDNFKPITLKKKINVSQDFIQVISNKISTNFLELKQIFLLRVLTQDLFFLVDEEGTTLNSRKEQIYLDNLTIEELDNLSIEPIIIPITGKIKRNNLEKNINLEFVIHPQPLTIDTVNKKAYFTVIKEFNYLDDTQEIINNPELWTDEEKKDFWEGLIKPFRDKGQKFYTNSKAFKKLPQREIKLEAGKFKQSGHFVDQKLRHNFDRDKKQISLFELVETQKVRNQIKDERLVEGIRLTQAEDRLLNTLVRLLSKKSSDYTGNLPAEKKAYGNEREVYPRLRITPSEFYREYTEKKNPSGKDRKEIKDTLLSLQDKKYLIIYKRHYWIEDKKKKKEERISRIEEYQSLIRVINYYDELTKEEDRDIKPGEMSEKGEIILELNPIFTDQIDTKFIEYPNDINRLTAIASGGYKKVSESIIRMRDYLMRDISAKNKVSEINEERLHYQLGLDKYIKEKRKKLINLRVNDAIEFAKNMGLVKEVRKETGAVGQYKYVFILNTDFNKQP